MRALAVCSTSFYFHEAKHFHTLLRAYVLRDRFDQRFALLSKLDYKRLGLFAQHREFLNTKLEPNFTSQELQQQHKNEANRAVVPVFESVMFAEDVVVNWASITAEEKVRLIRWMTPLERRYVCTVWANGQNGAKLATGLLLNQQLASLRTLMTGCPVRIELLPKAMQHQITIAVARQQQLEQKNSEKFWKQYEFKPKSENTVGTTDVTPSGKSREVVLPDDETLWSFLDETQQVQAWRMVRPAAFEQFFWSTFTPRNRRDFWQLLNADEQLRLLNSWSGAKQSQFFYTELIKKERAHIRFNSFNFSLKIKETTTGDNAATTTVGTSMKDAMCHVSELLRELCKV